LKNPFQKLNKTLLILLNILKKNFKIFSKILLKY